MFIDLTLPIGVADLTTEGGLKKFEGALQSMEYAIENGLLRADDVRSIVESGHVGTHF